LISNHMFMKAALPNDKPFVIISKELM